MELDKFIVTKTSLIDTNDPRFERWCDKWKQPLNKDMYDRIEMTDKEVNELLPQIETMRYGGSDLLRNPALAEFAFTIKSSDMEGENTIIFRKTVMPENVGIDSSVNGIAQAVTPLLDAYIFFGKSDIADVVLNIGSVRYENENNKEQYMTCTYQKPVWAKNDFIPMEGDDDGYIFEMFRYIKFAYMLIQKALYDRPVIFQEISGRRISCGRSGHGKKKQKRKVRAVKVMCIQNEEFKGYVKTQRKITCPSWGVIGHWRNYKSGKKVWINPYRKGRERGNADKYQIKEYLLENGGTADA